MTSRRVALFGATLAGLYLGTFASAGAATSPGATCASTRMKATGKRAHDLFACHARAIARGAAVDAACVARVNAAFTAAFAAADARGGCAESGDAAALAQRGDAFLGAALAMLPAEDEGPRCRTAFLAALARDVSRLAGADASYKKTPTAPFRLIGTRRSATSALAIALAHTRCATTPDASAPGRLAAAYVADTVGALSCGDGVRDSMEQCDGGDDGGCPGACSDCRCPAGAEPFACLSRPGPVTTLTGPQSNHYEDLALAAATKLDARAATFTSDSDNRYPLNVGGGADVCVAGGVFQGTWDRTLGWETMHDANNAAIRSEAARFTFDGPRIDDVTDGLRPVAGPFTVRQAWLSYVRDDCIENDHVRGGLVIDSLLDGCYVGVSERPSPDITRQRFDGKRDVLAIHRSLIRLEPMPGPRGGAPTAHGHGQFFKWDDHATALALHDSVFLAEQVGQGGADTMAVPDALVSCSNNTMVWLGAGPYPAPLPPCFTVTTNRAVWDAAVADWKAHHPAIGSTTP